jgi:hypothetical protein
MQRIGGWVGPTLDMDTGVERKKKLSLPLRETDPTLHQVIPAPSFHMAAHENEKLKSFLSTYVHYSTALF